MKAGYIVWGREFISPRVGWGKWLKIKGRNRFEYKDEAVDVADRCMAQFRNVELSMLGLGPGDLKDAKRQGMQQHDAELLPCDCEHCKRAR